MARFRLSCPAQANLAHILATSAERWGAEGRRRYAAILAAAMRQAAADPDGTLTRSRPELRPGPRGGIFFIGGLTRKFSTEQTRKASGQEKLKRLNLRQVLRPIYCLK